MKKMLFSGAALALALALSATTASATCYGKSCVKKDYGAGFSFGAGGEAENLGQAVGGLTGVWSGSTKDVYGGGDATDSTYGYPKANAYAGSHFATQGGSMALSGGWGGSMAGTSEYGMVQGGGNANAYLVPTND